MFEYLYVVIPVYFSLAGVTWTVWLCKEKKRRGHYPIVRVSDVLFYVPFWPLMALMTIFGPCDGPSTDEK